MFRLRRDPDGEKVEAVKLFLTCDKTTSGGARVRWSVLWQESDEAKKMIPRGLRTYL